MKRKSGCPFRYLDRSDGFYFWISFSPNGAGMCAARQDWEGKLCDVIDEEIEFMKLPMRNRQIIDEYSSGMSQKNIAKKQKISQQMVSKIINNM